MKMEYELPGLCCIGGIGRGGGGVGEEPGARRLICFDPVLYEEEKRRQCSNKGGGHTNENYTR